MTISDRVFEKLSEKKITQKELAEKTGISQSTISEWKSKGTNPTSEKILSLCRVLDVTPEWLLSGVDGKEDSNKSMDYYVVGKDTELGMIIEKYNRLEDRKRARVLGYIEALEAVK